MADWSGRHVVIVGIARQGKSLARYLVRHGAQVTVNDLLSDDRLHSARQELADLPLEWVCGGHPLSLLDRADLLCLSGGVPIDLPLVESARQRGIAVSNDSQIFLEAVPCQVVGVTGSAGKTTTTTLVGRMAQAHADDVADAVGASNSFRVWVGGNIGQPLLANLDQMSPGDIAVMELSSFQLEIMDRSPQVAAVLNVTPNHLDRHGTMAAYTAAKARILDYQQLDDTAVLGRDDPGAWGLRSHVRSRLVTFGMHDPLEAGLEGTYLERRKIMFATGEGKIELMPQKIVRLRGRHNVLNVLAASAISLAAGIPAPAVRAGVKDFAGVPHRLEFVRSWRGADWYNDSIATAPERTMAALHSFQEPIILLAGGRDKDLPWDAFADLVRKKVKHLILFGEAAGVISRAMGSFPYKRCEDLLTAVRTAASLVEPGDVVLLSPGGTSFDEFRNFEERGECFRKWVLEL